MNAATERDLEALQSFQTHRRALTGLAYRMLGSRAEAEDVVQDAYLRWHGADRDAVGDGDRGELARGAAARRDPLLRHLRLARQ